MAVKNYGRSITFPAPKPTTTTTNGPPLIGNFRTTVKSCHRSASLPTRLHPLSAHLDADLAAVRHWTSATTAAATTSAAWLADGLTLLHLLLASLPDLLLLPQAQESLRRHFWRRRRRSAASSCIGSPTFADRLLDDLLRLADAHGCFRSAVLDLRHQISATRAALRRSSDNEVPSRLYSCLRAQRRAERKVVTLASAVREASRRPSLFASVSGTEEAEVMSVLREVVNAAATASAAVLGGVAMMSAATVTVAPVGRSWMEVAVKRWLSRAKVAIRKRLQAPVIGQKGVEAGLRRWLGRAKAKSMRTRVPPTMSALDEERIAMEGWRRAVVKRLEVAEDGMASVEKRSELVFRALVNTRVALLNILTPEF